MFTSRLLIAALAVARQQSFVESVFAAFPIEAEEKSSLLIDDEEAGGLW